jgi:putative endonuclease
MGKTYFGYIMSNKSRRLYVGITSEFQARVFQHQNKWYEGSFTAFSNPSEAIEREKEIKGWRRERKLRLILAANPDWADFERRVGGR